MPPPKPSLRAALSALPHFRELPPEGLDRVAALCRPLELAAGEALFREGQAAEAFFVVLSGAVAVYKLAPDGREQVVHHVGPGRTLAEAALLQFRVYPANARAVSTPTRVLRIEGAGFVRLLAEDRSLATSMIGGLCVWLHLLLDRIEVLTRASAGARLAAWLLAQPARTAEGRLEVELKLAKKSLAAELSLTPETLSRLLRRWMDAGWVEVAGRRIGLLDVAALQALADGGDDASQGPPGCGKTAGG